MTALPPAPSTVPQPPVPRVLWAFALSFLAQDLVQLYVRGPKDDTVSVVGSVLLGVVVVVFFSVGVVRAARIRTGIVAVLLALVFLFGLVGLAFDPSVAGLAGTATAALQGVLLSRYTGTTWWDWQRTQPQGGRSVAPILAVAVLVGVLSGVAAQPMAAEGPQVSFNVSF